jgi:outer membrane immunogenic protein
VEIMQVWKCAAAFALVSSSAMGADLPVKTPLKAPPVESGYSWAGFYLGVNAGYSVGRDLGQRTNFTNPAPGLLNNFSSWHESPAGALGGIQAGYNWQINRLVFGIEADLQAADQKDRACLICSPTGDGSFLVDQRLPWFGTVRGRVGLAAGPVFSYFTGGLAFGRVETDLSLPIAGFPTTSVSQHENKTGWTFGSGVEAALGGNWTGKIEYLYVSLGSTTTPFFNSGTGNSRTAYTGDIRDHIFRAGVNYRLGPVTGSGAETAPAVAFGGWSGFYLGVDGGSGIARNPSALAVSFNGVPTTNEQLKLSPKGYLAGVLAGYNWQSGNWVLGVEADIQGARLKEDSVCLVVCVAGAITDLVEQKVSWFGTARGRLGYAAGPALFYVTGGLAFGDLKTTIVETVAIAPTVVAGRSDTKTGWTAGGGMELAVTSNWSTKTEYLYMDLGSTSLAFSNPVPGALLDHVFQSDSRTHIFRTSLNYRFGAPVIAKY